MSSPSPVEGQATQASSAAASEESGARATGQQSGDQARAALGPIVEPVSAAGNSVPAVPADSPAEAQGRRTLSTAFVMVGPDGRLTVELGGGRVLVLSHVVMGPKKYCGAQVIGARAGAQFCGGYADVVAARPGGAPDPEQPDLAVSTPVAPPR